MNSNKILHIFVYVVARGDDPFLGIRKNLARDSDTHVLREIRLSTKAYAQVQRVEYSRLKFFRLFFYRGVFFELKSSLDAALSEDIYGKCFIYVADEGVWGEFLMHALRDKLQKNIVTVNPQHGLHFLEEVTKFVPFRQAVNWFSKKLAGSPWFGLGLGGSRFNVYLMYGERERDFIRSTTTSLAYSCPRMIKASFIERYQHFHRNALDRTQDGGVRVLFAMEPIVLGAEFRCTEIDVYYSLIKLFDKVFSETGNKVIFRVHPGMNRGETVSLLRKTNLVSRIVIDDNEEVVETLCDIDVVMSFHSTVLFEASLLGKVPVQILNKCADKPLHLNQELLKLDKEGDENRISDILSRQTIEKYIRYREQLEDDLVDWSAFARKYPDI